MGWVGPRERGLGPVPETEPVSGNREPRGAVLLVVAGVVVLVLAGALLVVGAVRGLLPGTADCTVEVADRTVELGTDEAESAATVSASAVRQGAGPDTAADAVAEVTDLPGPDTRAVAD